VRELGTSVRVQRERLGLSQQALADRAGVTREWVVRFENGKVSVPLNLVFDVLTAVKLTIDLEEKVTNGE